MAVLKFLNNSGKWEPLYANALRNRMRCDKNLSDVYDIRESRKNLELVGDNNHTHYHDDRYKPLILQESEERQQEDDSLSDRIDDEVAERISEDKKIKHIIKKIKDELTPIGTIMAWAVNQGPQKSSEKVSKNSKEFAGLSDDIVWLECNGQSFSSSKYRELYNVLGKDSVPNFQGMFLRGAGSQYVADDEKRKKFNFDDSDASNIHNLSNIVAVSGITHTSGNIGEVQHDTIRNVQGALGHQQFAEVFNENAMKYLKKGEGNVFYFSRYGKDVPAPGHTALAMNTESHEGDGGSIEKISLDYAGNINLENDYAGWYNTFFKDTELVNNLVGNGMHCDVSFNLANCVPTSDEVRPANIAVKFFIRAK